MIRGRPSVVRPWRRWEQRARKPCRPSPKPFRRAVPRRRADPQAMAAEFDSAEPRTREIAWWIAARHPEWGGQLAGLLRERLAAQNLTPADREQLAAQLARFASATAVQDFLAERLGDSAATR